jgi:hypothetical protein
MAITKLRKHDKCPVSVNVCKQGSPHYAELVCNRHNKHIQWLNQTDAELIKQTSKQISSTKFKHRPKRKLLTSKELGI